MKKIILAAFLMMLFLTRSPGQTGTVKASSAIPQFRMQLTNGQYFSSAEIAKNKPFVLIYFAPDCDHCMILMDKLFKKIHQLDKASVVMITFKPLNELTAFEKKYNVPKYQNIRVGTEGTTYVVRNYYKLQKTPFTAVYDKKGMLVFSYKEETPVDEMLARLKKL
ncbi:MAG: redoxin domain-containing protein [Segetibacter sp.]